MIFSRIVNHQFGYNQTICILPYHDGYNEILDCFGTPLRQVTTALGIGSSHSLPTHLAIGRFQSFIYGGFKWRNNVEHLHNC
jgi:hypothetical protein